MQSYIAINNDLNIRQQSSSGGIFSALATYVLQNQGIVFGAAWNSDWLVDIINITNLKDLSKLRGSKYIQANINNTYQECKDYLDAGKLVLYSGIPCQLHGLKKFLAKDYDNLILVDIACHGLMSINIWKDYLKTIQRPDASIIEINFRYKELTWEDYHVLIKYSDGQVLNEHHSTNKYIQAFLSDKYLKSSCYDCQFKNSYSISDLIIGDAWGTKSPYKSQYGISFIQVLTDKGQEFLNKITTISKILQEPNYQANGCFKNKISITPAKSTLDLFQKKVGIITLHLIDNYGGTLQAWALNKYITGLGYKAETITWKDSRILDFAKKNIPLRTFNTSRELKNIKQSDYDILVVGSDQIWRHRFITGDFGEEHINIPFLQFTNGWNKTRISYAASIGVAGENWEYPEIETKNISNLLQNFNAISVREIQSVQDCKNKLNLNVTNCVDPTLLISRQEYLKLCENEAPYAEDIFVYLLDETQEKITEINSYCKKNNLSYFKTRTKTVESWLAAFRDAKYIITDSFHGCIFALLFNKPFICLYNKWRGNARFDSLIQLFNINKNIIYSIKDLQGQIFYKPQELSQQNILDSKVFLQSSLALPAKIMNFIPYKKLEQKVKPYLYF